MPENLITRREFVKKGVTSAVAFSAFKYIYPIPLNTSGTMRLGLVTYQWGRDWDLPTLISNCARSGFAGVELRTRHAHKVEINLNAKQRADVRKLFADSNVICVGYGSNFEYHSPDPSVLRDNINQTKEYLMLCRDIGATGIKVKPNDLPPEVPKEKTIAQIAASLNEVGKFAADLGQVVRVEVHGEHTQELPIMKAIFEQVTSRSVKICWNCNDTDLLSPGLEANFGMVSKWFGDTLHVREMDSTDYPYRQLFELLKGIGYSGWILLEARTEPADRVAAMKQQHDLFMKLTSS